MKPFKKNKSSYLYGFLGALVFLASCAGTPVVESSEEDEALKRYTAVVSTQKVADGAIAMIHVKPKLQNDPNAADFQAVGDYQGVQFPFYSEKNSDQSQAGVFGVPYQTAEGESIVRVTVTDEAGSEVLRVRFQVQPGDYASETLTVSPDKVVPPAKNLARIKRESKEVGKIYRRITQNKLWTGPFVLPINSAVTSDFGTRRVFNGELASFHKGLDLRASVGTPILAPAGGRIVLAKNLYYTGNTILMDHGLGLYTLYAHLSKIKVSVGRRIEAGALIGLAGATGRVNGPHLHWGAILNTVKVNPLDLIRVLN